MRLTVTAEDIRDGKRESCSSCPMALALNRAGFETAYVNLWFVRESANGLPLFSLSESAMQFIADFDAGKPVQPATFVLREVKLMTLKSSDYSMTFKFLNGVVTGEVTCCICDRTFTLNIPEKEWLAWQNGELIQRAMPSVSDDDRELLITATCGACFEGMFEDDDQGDEEEAVAF
jgi:hypothetical protein